MEAFIAGIAVRRPTCVIAHGTETYWSRFCSCLVHDRGSWTSVGTSGPKEGFYVVYCGNQGANDGDCVRHL